MASRAVQPTTVSAVAEMAATAVPPVIPSHPAPAPAPQDSAPTSPLSTVAVRPLQQDIPSETQINAAPNLPVASAQPSNIVIVTVLEQQIVTVTVPSDNSKPQQQEQQQISQKSDSSNFPVAPSLDPSFGFGTVKPTGIAPPPPPPLQSGANNKLTTDAETSESGNMVKIIAGVSSALILVIAIIALAVWVMRRKSKKKGLTGVGTLKRLYKKPGSDGVMGGGVKRPYGGLTSSERELVLRNGDRSENGSARSAKKWSGGNGISSPFFTGVYASAPYVVDVQAQGVVTDSSRGGNTQGMSNEQYQAWVQQWYSQNGVFPPGVTPPTSLSRVNYPPGAISPEPEYQFLNQSNERYMERGRFEVREIQPPPMVWHPSQEQPYIAASNELPLTVTSTIQFDGQQEQQYQQQQPLVYFDHENQQWIQMMSSK
ncbi:hypothetical protein BDR26DRAFT_871979 [Obelidium mucronatum]|nr:hypothetical protein BDR26DRAFT_871979 [Obelidium mucronatum]